MTSLIQSRSQSTLAPPSHPRTLQISHHTAVYISRAFPALPSERRNFFHSRRDYLDFFQGAAFET